LVVTIVSLDGRAAGYTDARNFILTVPVSSESLPRLIEPVTSSFRWQQ